MNVQITFGQLLWHVSERAERNWVRSVAVAVDCIVVGVRSTDNGVGTSAGADGRLRVLHAPVEKHYCFRVCAATAAEAH